MPESIRDRVTRILDEAHVPAVDIHEDEPGGSAHVRAPGYLITDSADLLDMVAIAIVGRDGIPDSSRQYERAGLRATAVFALHKAGFTTEACGDSGDGILAREA